MLDVLVEETDDYVVENESPREGNITYAPILPPTLLMNTDTNQKM